MKQMKFITLILMIALWSVSGIASAQGGIINYGETRTDRLSSEAPQVLYSLTGNADEVLTVYILGSTEALQPSVTILGPTGQLGFSSSDALTPIKNDARVTAKLPQAGNYSILVASTTPTLDAFTIAVRLTTPGISTQLGADPVTINIPPGGESLAYTILPSPTGDTPITVASGTAGFTFAGTLSAPDGRILLAFDGAMPSLTVMLPAGTEPYTLVIRSSDPTLGGTLTISQSGAVASTTTSAPNPVVTEEVTGNTGNPPPANQCAAVAGGNGSNVRTGPGTDYGVLRTLAPGDYLIVTGQNNGWYTDGVAWVAGSVVTLTGPCDNLPQAAVTTAPLATATAVPPTQTTDTTQPTATYTATTETTQPTATYTPTEDVQIAVIDSDQLNMTVDRDAGGTYTNDVSSPNGDTKDRIRLTIDNLSNQTPNNYRELSITLVCSGDGAANLRWGTGGPTSPNPRGCNESITAVHTNDSNQTFINVEMTGSGYIQYTIIVTVIS